MCSFFFISAALQRRSQPAVEDKETRPAPANTRNLRMSVDYINKKKRFDNMTQLILKSHTDAIIWCDLKMFDVLRS